MAHEQGKPCQSVFFKENNMKKALQTLTALFVLLWAVNLYAVEEGFMWTLRANFNGSATLPSISKSDLDKMSAGYMDGLVGYTMDGELEIGYLFGSRRWFHMEPDTFSGVSLFGSLGVGNGYTGEKAGNTINDKTVNMLIHVNYTPVVTFGVGSEAYFLKSRISAGLWIGGKVVASLSPEYVAYADDKDVNTSIERAGRIVVNDFMMKNMNPLMFSMKTMFNYHQPLFEHVELTVGTYLRMNIWKPKYITMPDDLMGLMNDQLKKDGKPEFSLETPLPSFYLNSLDFGVSIGLTFKA